MGCVPSTERAKNADEPPVSSSPAKKTSDSLPSKKGEKPPASPRPGLPALSQAAAGKVPQRAVGGEGIGHARFILEKPGKITDHYDFDKKIGQGAYGAVRRATTKSQHAQVRAVKTISKKSVASVERFKQEIGIMKMMDHPNIIRLFETFEDQKNVYLVMEMCVGGELFDRIVSAGHFTEACAATAMQQIFRAVFYMHESGIVHRDLKPENFLLLNKGPIDRNVVKIIDFGLSCRWQPGQELTTKVGTPYYVAPQVLAGHYDNSCDLWSCGVILYILLAGYPPFAGQSDAEVFAKVRQGHVSFDRADWRFISQDAQELIKNLLKLRTRERYNAQQALNHKWIKNASPSAPRVSLRPGFVESMRAFRSQSKLKKAALHIIAGQLSEERIKGLRETFVALDENGDGLLTFAELKVGMNKAGLTDIPEDLQQIMDGLDADGSGFIDYSEFLAATLDRRTYLQEDVCWAAFNIFDLDNDGRITQSEIKQVLAVDGVSEAMGLKNAAAIIGELDKNGDGSLDFREFMEMMRDVH